MSVMMREAKITINGHELTEGQSMTLRVACTNFSMEIGANGELATLLGAETLIGYRRGIVEILRLIGETEA